MGAAKQLRDSGSESSATIALISPDDALVIRPRLYEADLRGVRVPLRPMLSAVKVEYHQATVELIDTGRRILTLRGPSREAFSYDQLILCGGSAVRTPDHVKGVHSVDDYRQAVALQRAIASLSERGRASFSTTVVGAGFAGLELAAELAGTFERAGGSAGEIPAGGSVCLVEQASSVAPEFGSRARMEIEREMRSLGVALRTGQAALGVDSNGVTLAGGERIDSELTVWTAGPRANRLNEQLGLPLDPRGRVTVNSHMSTAIDGIWVAGDSARVYADDRHLASMSCQHAIPQGRQAGVNAAAAILGQPFGRYSQPLYLTCLDLGSAGALITSGFERDVIMAKGIQGKRFKRFVNRSLIYPPPGAEAAKLLLLGRRSTPRRAGAMVQRWALRSNLMRSIPIVLSEDRAEQYATGGDPGAHV